MTAKVVTRPVPASKPTEPRLRAGWITIAGKEFTDHLLSARLYVLLVVLGIAALIPLYFAADQIRSVAANASITPAVFLYLFRLAPEEVPILRVDLWISIAAPLLGVAFAFDAINGERSEGTLPRLLARFSAGGKSRDAVVVS